MRRQDWALLSVLLAPGHAGADGWGLRRSPINSAVAQVGARTTYAALLTDVPAKFAQFGDWDDDRHGVPHQDVCWRRARWRCC